VDGDANGNFDAFLTRLNETGSGLWYSTLLGGGQQDLATGVGVDASRNAILVGFTVSGDFPTTGGAFDTTHNGDEDAFVSKLPTQINGFARPKAASPSRFALVIAYRECTDPNEIHGPPLAYPSCGGLAKTSGHLTVGTADSNGMPALSDGFVRFKTLIGNPATPADEADVRLDLSISDVLTNSLDDYDGDLRAQYTLRLTDRDSPGPPGESPTATVSDFPLGFTAPCAPDADPLEGSTCSVATTVDAQIPGAVKEGLRSIWALQRIRVFDGGADGDGDTVGDNTLFATQGVFIP